MLLNLQHFPLDRTSSPWNPLWRMGAGASAGIFATILTHPIDVVRARLTIQSQMTQHYRGTHFNYASVICVDQYVRSFPWNCVRRTC